MTTFNGYTVIRRGERPSPLVPAQLDFYNYITGALIDPFQVCSVHIFPNTAFGTADPYVNRTAGDANYGLVSSVATNMLFHNYKRNSSGDRIGFDANMSAMDMETNYTGDRRFAASAIFKEKNGHFVVILEPSGAYFKNSAPSQNWDPQYNNTASATGGYLDIWTVVQTEGSRAQIYVNTFNMETANTFAVTEPLEVTTTNKLVQRYIELGSKKRVQVKTALVVDNEPIKESLRNLIETGALISNASMRIVKLNDSPALSNRVMIADFADTASTTLVSSDGQISYLWDTNAITAKYSDDLLGGARGVYEISVKYDVAEETIYSPKFKLIVR